MPLITGSKSDKKVLRELIENKDSEFSLYKTKEELSAIKHWLKHQQHLPKLTDEQLILFLHCNYFSIERTKETIDNYFTYRTHAPDIFTNRNPVKNISTALKVANFCIIPPKYKTPDGCRVIIIKFGDKDPSKFNFGECVKAALAVIDCEIAQAPLADGVLAILDMSGVQLGHIPKITLTVLKKIMMYIQEAIPVRLKGIHVINTLPIVHQIMALIRPLMKQELADILHFHSPTELEEFCKQFVPKSMMPSDYGGEQISFKENHDQVCKKLEMFADWLKELESYQVDEKKRVGRSKSASDIYGMEGSFKRLTLD